MADIASIIIACISLLGTICTAGFTTWATLHRDRINRRPESQKLIDKYSDPLLLASLDLQSRIQNIVENKFLRHNPGGPSRDEFVKLWTIFLFGQYFSWIWILRRQVQYLKFSTSKQTTHELAAALELINDAFHRSRHVKHPHFFALWYGQQMAIGEVMSVKDENGKELVCIGYTQFKARYSSTKEEDEKFTQWFKSIEDGIKHLSQCDDEAVFNQLTEIQHLLLGLIKILDRKMLVTGTVAADMKHIKRQLSGCRCRYCDKDIGERGGHQCCSAQVV